jgi:hypothetical protein
VRLLLIPALLKPLLGSLLQEFLSEYQESHPYVEWILSFCDHSQVSGVSGTLLLCHSTPMEQSVQVAKIKYHSLGDW